MLVGECPSAHVDNDIIVGPEKVVRNLKLATLTSVSEGGMIYHLLQSKLYFILRRKPFLLVSTIVGCADITALAFDMIFASRIGCAKWCTESHQIKIKSPVCKFRIFTYCYDFRFSRVCMCDLNRNAVQYNSKKNNEFFIDANSISYLRQKRRYENFKMTYYMKR